MMNAKRCVPALALVAVAACAPSSDAYSLFWDGTILPAAEGSGGAGDGGAPGSTTSSSSSSASSSGGGDGPGGAAPTGAGGAGGAGGEEPPPECELNSDCPALAGGCVTQRCDAGVCVDDVIAPDQTPCADGYCDSVRRACRPVATCLANQQGQKFPYSCGQDRVYYVRFHMNEQEKSCTWDPSTWGACTPGTNCGVRLGVTEFHGTCVE
jgi:hypothetical protein